MKRLAMVVACTACGVQASGPAVMAVGAEAVVTFSDRCTNTGNDSLNTTYGCEDETVREILSATVGSPFEVTDTETFASGLDETGARVTIRANAAGSATLTLRYLDPEGETNTATHDVAAREVDRVTFAPQCSQIGGSGVIAGNDLFVMYTFADAAGARLAGQFAEPPVTSSDFVWAPRERQPQFRFLAGADAKLGVIAPTIGNGPSLEIPIIDPARATIDITASQTSMRYYDKATLRITASLDQVPLCEPPVGPWQIVVDTPLVCGLRDDLVDTATWNDAVWTTGSEPFIKAKATIGTCTVRVTHATNTAWTKTIDIAVCDATPCAP